MNAENVAIMLGGTAVHGVAIQKLKERGFFTVLVDYFKNPPAAKYADIHLQKSAMDYEEVLAIAKEYNAKVVLAPCLDQQMVIAVQVAEALGLPHPFSYETVMNVTNKKLMKKIMIDNNLPTSKYYQVDNYEDIDKIDFEYPVIVKPVDNSGAAGVRKVMDRDSLKEAFTNASKWSRTHDVIVEEFKEGLEFSAYLYIKNNKAKLITTQTRFSAMSNDIVKCYGTRCPTKLTPEEFKHVEEVGTDIARAFKLNNTPLFYQAIVKNDEFNIIEFSPRLGGGVCYRFMELNASYDMLNAAIDSWLGLENNRVPNYHSSLHILYQIQGTNGIFDRIDGYQEMIDQGYIKEIFFHKDKGDHIGQEKASAARVAAIMIAGEDMDSCLEKLKFIMKNIQVLDENGNDITDRSSVKYDGIRVHFE